MVIASMLIRRQYRSFTAIPYGPFLVLAIAVSTVQTLIPSTISRCATRSCAEHARASPAVVRGSAQQSRAGLTNGDRSEPHIRDKPPAWRCPDPGSGRGLSAPKVNVSPGYRRRRSGRTGGDAAGLQFRHGPRQPLDSRPPLLSAKHGPSHKACHARSRHSPALQALQPKADNSGLKQHKLIINKETCRSPC